MSRVHGKNSDFSFNTVALEGELNSVTMNVNVPPADVTAFADTYQVALAGKKNVTTEIAGALDMLAGAGNDNIFQAVGNGPKSTIFDLTGSGPGANAPEYQCTAAGITGVYVTRYHISLPVGDKAGYTASLQHSGLTSRAVA